jgi:hypothetical protein
MAAFTQLTYANASPQILPQALNETSTTQKLPLGTTRKGLSSDGEAEFIYLLGVGSTTIGSWVTYNPDDWSTTLLVPNAIGPVAVAYSANIASQYGWYMLRGKADARSGDVADNAKVYIDTVAGLCDDAVVAGDKVHNAKWASADDTGVAGVGGAEVEIAYPFVTDEST